MSELDYIFANRPVVEQALSGAREMAVQTDDDSGKTLSLEEQIAMARAQE